MISLASLARLEQGSPKIGEIMVERGARDGELDDGEWLRKDLKLSRMVDGQRRK